MTDLRKVSQRKNSFFEKKHQKMEAIEYEVQGFASPYDIPDFLAWLHEDEQKQPLVKPKKVKTQKEIDAENEAKLLSWIKANADTSVVSREILNKRKENFALVARDKDAYEQEFNHLFNSLKQNDAQSSNEQWLYAYYCCLLLKLYYQGYDQKNRAQDYQELAEAIKKRCVDGKFPKSNPENLSFLQFIKKKLKEDFGDLVETPFHLSNFRNKAAFLNICRLYWAFCRLMLVSGLQLANNTKIIEKLDKALGLHTNVDDIINVLNAPNSIFRALSVGFFVARIALHTASLIKHTCFPSAEEEALPWQERLKSELIKRHPDYVNDVVWAIVNGVTNFNDFFHIAGSTAGWITAGFLFFDAMWILYQWNLAENKYQDKRKQYENELLALQAEIDAYHETLSKGKLTQEAEEQIEEFKEKINLTLSQQEQNELSIRVQRASYMFYAVAALLLFSGFTASMVFTPLGAVAACYAICTLAAGMYLSGGVYKVYKEKSIRLEDAKQRLAKYQPLILNQADDKNTDPNLKATLRQLDKTIAKLELEKAAARNDFIFNMIKNTVVPAVIITTFAVCWQAAIVLVVAYAAYELYNSRQKNLTADKVAEIENDESFGGLVPV